MSGIIKKNNKTVVIGGGAAGMLAAIFSAQKGNSVVLIEKNEKLGKKLYITGKGRCNLTNDCTVDEFLANVVTNSRFLSSALYSFSPENTIEFFENQGLKLKTERGNRVFPLSDKSSDVIKCLESSLRTAGVNVKLNERVLTLQTLPSFVIMAKTLWALPMKTIVFPLEYSFILSWVKSNSDSSIKDSLAA